MRGFIAMMLLGCVFATDAADGVWRGPILSDMTIKGEHFQKTPFLCHQGKTWFLRGKGVISLQEIDAVRGRHYVIHGRESADGKSITVRKMEIQTEWEGRVHWMVNAETKHAHGLLMCEDYKVAVRLAGPKLPPPEELKKRLVWEVKGEMDATGLVVSEIKLKDPQPPMDPRFVDKDRK